MGHQALTEVLGYPSSDAFERSVQRGHLALRVMRLPGRRGLFALATEVAAYLMEVSNKEALMSRDLERSERKVAPKN